MKKFNYGFSVFYFFSIYFLLHFMRSHNQEFIKAKFNSGCRTQRKKIGRVAWHFAEVFTGSSWVGFVVCRDTSIQNMHPAACTSRAVAMLLSWALKPTSPQSRKHPSQLKTKDSALAANRTKSSGDNKVFEVDEPFLLKNQHKKNHISAQG